jgi:hypothetical protein
MCCSASIDKQHRSGCCTQKVLIPERLLRKHILEHMWEWKVEALPAKQLCLVGKEREFVQIEAPWCSWCVLYFLVLVLDLVMLKRSHRELCYDEEHTFNSIY